VSCSSNWAQRKAATLLGSIGRTVKHLLKVFVISSVVWNVAWAIPLVLAPVIDKLATGTSAIDVYTSQGHTWAFYAVWYLVTFCASLYIGRIAQTSGWFFAGVWALFTPFMTTDLLGLDYNTAVLYNVAFMAVSAFGGFVGQRIFAKKPRALGTKTPGVKSTGTP
jgi:hypothetical protein